MDNKNIIIEKGIYSNNFKIFEGKKYSKENIIMGKFEQNIIQGIGVVCYLDY